MLYILNQKTLKTTIILKNVRMRKKYCGKITSRHNHEFVYSIKNLHASSEG
jgi:hypothetical protein